MYQEFKSNGLNVFQFIAVANVYQNQVISSKSRISYGFDDGTGKISGYKLEAGTRYYPYALDDYCSNTFLIGCPNRPFAYATILGQLHKDSDGSVAVKVLYIRPLTDAHEIYFHLLHVIFDDLRYERGNPVSRDHIIT
jgi:hypothetical protein